MKQAPKLALLYMPVVDDQFKINHRGKCNEIIGFNVAIYI